MTGWEKEIKKAILISNEAGFKCAIERVLLEFDEAIKEESSYARTVLRDLRRKVEKL